MIRRPPRSTLFPYTTALPICIGEHVVVRQEQPRRDQEPRRTRLRPPVRGRPDPADRSEEHTSELQSQSNLVCRLLLEKKKKCSPLQIWSMHTRVTLL